MTQNIQNYIDEIEDYVGGNIEGNQIGIDRMGFTVFLRTTLTKVAEEAYKAGYIKGGLDEQMTLNPQKIADEARLEEHGVFAYHGTNKEHALKIITDGFAVGTHFAHHLEEAFELGGSWVFRVRMDKKPLNWQWVISEHIPPAKIDRLTQFQPIVRIGKQPHLTRKVDSEEESRNLDGVPLTPPTDNPKSVWHKTHKQ